MYTITTYSSVVNGVSDLRYSFQLAFNGLSHAYIRLSWKKMRAVSRSIVSSHFSIISTASRIVSYRIKKWERQSHLSFEKSFENHEQRIKGSFVEQKSGIFLTSISGFFVMRNAPSSLLQWVRLQPTGANTQVSVEIRENPRIVWTVLLSGADMTNLTCLFQTRRG